MHEVVEILDSNILRNGLGSPLPPLVDGLNCTCVGGGSVHRAVIGEDAEEGLEMCPVWDDLVAYHALTKLLGEFHCNVAVLKEKPIRLFGKGELAFGHRFEKEDRKTRDEATIGRRIGVKHQRTQQTVEVPIFMKNRETDEEAHDAFERGKDPVRRQEMGHEDKHGWTQVRRDKRQICDDEMRSLFCVRL